MIKLSARLKCAAEELGNVRSFADIGTDHGKLIIYALEHGLTERAFAVDISDKSLSKARRNVEERSLSDKVSFICGDGLMKITELPEAIVIAGMGGNEIAKILSDRRMDTKYILLPHQDAHVVRKYLCSNGYSILKDYVIKDGKYYSVITAERGDCLYTDSEMILGRNYPETKEFEERVIERKKAIESIVAAQKIELDALQEEIKSEYEEILKWLKSRKQ